MCHLTHSWVAWAQHNDDRGTTYQTFSPKDRLKTIHRIVHHLHVHVLSFLNKCRSDNS
uniref:Uncharacterized protein n=1 Tax=Arundo donax TaxID=35708 RepID=A0A0A9U7C0_ARUDO